MNEEFLNSIKDLLQDDYPLFEKEIGKDYYRGFRINNLKIKQKDFFDLVDIKCHKSPFAKNGYYLDEEDITIGKTPFYNAGLIYMQEPSASAAVTALDIKKGMKVLDLCAAPGSKTTQIAENLEGTGLIVANEYDASRAEILKENIERSGATNVIITNNDTSVIADTFPLYFDAVLCDAPCSGEGMFRKEKQAITNWSRNNVELCAKRQLYILENAYKALKPGGTLLYSTCTFNKKENEDNIETFLNKHPDMEIIKIDVNFGRRAFASLKETDKALRIFPFDGGEGHFICKMQKKLNDYDELKLSLWKSEEMKSFTKEFLKDNLKDMYPYYFVNHGRVYAGINPFYKLDKVKLIRYQVYLGEEKNGRFEPFHNLYMSSYTNINNVIDLENDEINKFLKGETITKNINKGYYGVSYKGYLLGHVKSDGKILKNKYPKQYRFK